MAALIAASPATAVAYDYPIEDRWLATVVGTPDDLRYPVPAKVPESTEELRRFPDRKIPDVFWNDTWMRYGLSPQRGRAPLAFVIAGTGAGYHSAKNRYLRDVLWGAGFHVVTLSSPTYENFLLSASTDRMPGFMPADTKDLYEVMKAAYGVVERRHGVEGVYLTGYSLGASEAAFLAELDAEQGFFDFAKVYLINPSVNLYSSVKILDRLFEKTVGDSPDKLEELLVRLLKQLTLHVQTSKEPLDNEMLYRIAAAADITTIDLELLIAFVFRLASGEIVFASDVVHGGGHIVERGTRLKMSTSLTLYGKRALRWPFTKYMDDMWLPYWQERFPGLDRERAIELSGLSSIADYLAGADHVAVATNRDDFILADGEIAFLEKTFGPRAKIYPTGGHCGNMMYRDNVEHMLEFFDVPVSADAR